MEEQQAATPPEAAPEQQPTEQSFDDKLLAKFGLGETVENEGEPPATPADGEPEVEVEADPEEVPVAGEFEIKHNGEIKKLPIPEAQRLVQMGYDYEHKMQRVNNDAQQVQAMASAYQARFAMQAQAFDALVEARSFQHQLQVFQTVDWLKESESDPVAAFQKRMQFDRLVGAYNGAMQKAQHLQQPLEQAQQQIDASQVELQTRKLHDRIPEWKDAERAKKDRTAIVETMVNHYGFAPNEIGGPLLGDHRVVAILHDAMKYRAAKVSAKTKQGSLQGTPKVATPGAKPPPRSQAQSLGDIKRGLRQVQSKEARKALEDELIARKFGLK